MQIALAHFGRQPILRADNIMSLLMLAAPCGSVLLIEAEGLQAEEALAALEALFEARFDEDS